MTKQLKQLEYDDTTSISEYWNDQASDYEKEAYITVMCYGGQRINGREWKKWVDCCKNLRFEDFDKVDQDYLIRLNNAKIKQWIDIDNNKESCLNRRIKN